MKSKTYRIDYAISYIRGIINIISKDKLTVYAGQASFFVVTSSVPFISLLFALFSIILPDEVPVHALFDLQLSAGVSTLLSRISAELSSAPAVSLLSISALTTLWSASRGIASIRRGIETIYNADEPVGYVHHRFLSILTTLLFISLIVAVVVLLLFDDVLVRVFGDWIGVTFMKLRTPLFILVMTVFFTLTYYSVGKRSRQIKHSFLCHLPGAVFSSVGWIGFSFIYSLYIENFPGASYIYGSLAAVCLIMLWLYFCIVILLLGAEVNKLYFAGKSKYTHKGVVK